MVAVVPPWNFPLAIPAGGVLARAGGGQRGGAQARAADTAHRVRPGRSVLGGGRAARSSSSTSRCPDGPVGEHLIGHPGVDAIILTGAYETAQLFARLAPATPLFAETSGKNAIVVLPDADLDLAVADLVRSAFGHAGQKCSAASLAICVGEVATSARFRRQLVDATSTLVVGDAQPPNR